MSDQKPKRPEWAARTTPRLQGNEHWWPDQLTLHILHQKHPDASPFGPEFRYGEAFSRLDVDELTADVDALMTDSQDWWPADWGHYGPFFIRMSWHAAGTYRAIDGRGGGGTGAQRFAPLNSWPDNGNLDKARRLLWPIKKKYGEKISWADLLVFAGNRALETMGFRTFGFGFGRADIWAPEDDIYWGPETEWLATKDERYTGSWEDGNRLLDNPLAAVQMGLIYVNPEGPNGIPDAMKSAKDVRETFARMGMNDRETAALTIGGHTFGKMHGNGPADAVGEAPEGAKIFQQGIGWANKHETGLGEYTVTSGLEGAWTPTPTQWDNSYLNTIFAHQWEVKKSPAGANQWEPVEVKEGYWVPDAHVPGKKNPPVMNTADMAMITDPAYLEICKEFHQNPDKLADEFARAWYKLLHRDMGPQARYLGPQVPDEVLVWQDPVPKHEGPLVDEAQIATLKQQIADSGLTVKQLVGTAWASACTYRQTDHRGGANGARIRLDPQAGWDVNVRSGVPEVLDRLEQIRSDSGINISLADMIVLAGSVGVETAAKAGGHDITVPFTPGRTDATQEMTEVDTHAYLEPRHDAFRNYMQPQVTAIPAEHLMVDRAFMLNLSVPQMAALLGGMRAMGINVGDSNEGIFTDRPGQLTNDFFANLVDMGTVWEPVDESEERFVGKDRATGEQKWTATRVDLIYGSNSQLRAIAEEYAADGGEERMIDRFVKGWVKVMENDRFDLHR
ncbi:catalase/peroxidase HPI [Halomonas sp. McH1-25]|uniref:catalase/peroxidase HPI n=1 Tax=unclassified Halomonas TaxID=2609666 RepID=UPI001EF44151|nr:MULTISPECIES: catalase/peroxidase HPI [unclassified Halomonas]MCG7598242.1 catalase/peroxidase HPI [Halomonas sp. McH1-25]MCP1340975.1 catalase/peroxidase HPI [Halomonas sp. FL8]MCP1361459.1 catalase/peroxidase HPI [Halomonas sp. BBD45]